jgi:hypothetical protein
MEHGSKTMRFTRIDQSSACQFLHTILGAFLQEKQDKVLQIQRELVDLRCRLPQTDAGRNLLCSLEEIFEMQTKEISESDGSEQGKILQERKVEVKKQIKALKLPFFTRILVWLGM